MPSLKALPSTSVKGRKWGEEIAATTGGTLGDVWVGLAQELPEQGFWPEARGSLAHSWRWQDLEGLRISSEVDWSGGLF